MDVAQGIAAFGGILYSFYSFYLVTDLRLVPAVVILCKRWRIPDDVAGATILGAALNSPELFSAIVGLFVRDSPVGLGLILGSFNFNILVITGFTAILARQKLRSRQLKIEWLYLQRDVYFYLAAVLLFIWVNWDSEVAAYEAGIMLFLYMLYILTCAFTGSIARHCCPTRRKRRRRRDLKILLADPSGKSFTIVSGAPRKEQSASFDEWALGRRTFAIADRDVSATSVPECLLHHNAHISAQLLSDSGFKRLDQKLDSTVSPLTPSKDAVMAVGRQLVHQAFPLDSHTAASVGGATAKGEHDILAMQQGPLLPVESATTAAMLFETAHDMLPAAATPSSSKAPQPQQQTGPIYIANGGWGDDLTQLRLSHNHSRLKAKQFRGCVNPWTLTVEHSHAPPFDERCNNVLSNDSKAGQRGGSLPIISSIQQRLAFLFSDLEKDDAGHSSSTCDDTEDFLLAGHTDKGDVEQPEMVTGDVSHIGDEREAMVDLRLVSCAFDSKATLPMAQDVLGKAVGVELDEAAKEVVVEHSELLLVWPHNASFVTLAFWFLSLPIKLLVAFTVPAPKEYFYTFRYFRRWQHQRSATATLAKLAGNKHQPVSNSHREPSPLVSKNTKYVGNDTTKPLRCVLDDAVPPIEPPPKRDKSDQISFFGVPQSFYPFTMLLSVFWLGLISYVLSYLSSKFGKVIGVSEEVIGLTVDCIGTSLPNVIAAVIAGRRGNVETAVCQAFGSNIFDILVAFAVPYGIKALIEESPAKVSADTLLPNGISDLACLSLFVVALFASRMRLNRAVGCFCK